MNNTRQNVRSHRRKSNLSKRCWAVIAAHYISCDLTHEEAVAEAEYLRRRRQSGVTIVSNAAARKLFEAQEADTKLAA